MIGKLTISRLLCAAPHLNRLGCNHSMGRFDESQPS